jgi:AcrR family transcriptional regulator
MQNSQETQDLRVQRTRKSLQQALFSLTVEKGFAAVTVHDITKRAMVNRSTFYHHYLDKYDMLQKYMDELQEQVVVTAATSEITQYSMSERVPAGLLFLLHHVREQSGFYRVMLGPGGNQEFTHRFRQLSENRYRCLFAKHPEANLPHLPPVAMRLSYISSAVVGAILWWLEQEHPISVEQLANWLGQLSMTTAGLSKPTSTYKQMDSAKRQ